MKIVYEYLDQLRALGLYESSTIIVMADHGIPEDEDLTLPVLSALFVKPAGSYGTPLAINMAQVSHSQFPGMILESLLGDSMGYAPGFFATQEGEDIVREYTHKRYRYEIRGDGRDFGNWHGLGEYSGQWEDSKAG